MKYLSIKDAAARFKKSESSIKRAVAKIKSKNPETYIDSKSFKFERLPNGKDKILISEPFLKAWFARSNTCLVSESIKNTKNNTTEDSSHSSSSEYNSELVISSYQKTIEVLERELERKNNHIDELLKLQHEVNVLSLGGKQVRLLDSSKKSWWQFWKNNNKLNII